jgi:hypothetical protein
VDFSFNALEGSIQESRGGKLNKSETLYDQFHPRVALLCLGIHRGVCHFVSLLLEVGENSNGSRKINQTFSHHLKIAHKLPVPNSQWSD